MKVLQVIHSFPPYFSSGSELYTYNITRELSKSMNVYIFHRIPKGERKEYEILLDRIKGLNIFKVNYNWLEYFVLNDFSEKNNKIDEIFRSILDKIKPDVVHFQHLIQLSISMINEAKKRNIPIVFTLHDYWLICPQIQLFYLEHKICRCYSREGCRGCIYWNMNYKSNMMKFVRKLKRVIPGLKYPVNGRYRLLRQILDYIIQSFMDKPTYQKIISRRNENISKVFSSVDLFISPSVFLKKKITGSKLFSNKIIHSKYGISLPLSYKKNKKTNKNINIGFRGQLIFHKGVHVLIRAFKRIKDPNVVLKIYGGVPNYGDFHGDYSYEELLKNLADGSNVRFLGPYFYDNINKILDDIDLLVVPSIWYENCPITILESFANRTPVIASNIGGIPELVKHRVNGLLFKPGDSVDLYNKINYVCENPEVIGEFSNNISGVKTIEENAEELKKIYKNLIEGKF